MLELFTTVYAEAPQNTEAPVNGGMFSLIWLIGMIAIFYFMLIRPQNKQEKKTKQMLASLQVGDKVVTIGGICGRSYV